MSMQAARVVHWIHWIFLLFVIFGWLLPWQAVWIVHLFVVPGLVIHWRMNENRCILTEMEERLKKSTAQADNFLATEPRLPNQTQKTTSEEEAVEGQFIRGVIQRLTGKTPSDAFMTSLIYGVMGLVWLISLGRVANALFSALRTF